MINIITEFFSSHILWSYYNGILAIQFSVSIPVERLLSWYFGEMGQPISNNSNNLNSQIPDSSTAGAISYSLNSEETII